MKIRSIFLLFAILSLLIVPRQIGAEVNAGGIPADVPPLQVPKAIILSKLTPVYDQIEGNELYTAAPQFVKVVAAEDSWESKLLQGDTAIWFEIDTKTGQHWIHVQDPQFSEDAYDGVLLTGDEQIYTDRSRSEDWVGKVSAPQVVHAIYSDHGDYLIQTWLGFKWMHPIHKVYEHAHQLYNSLSVILHSTMPMFASPDAGGEVIGWLSPQDVISSLNINDEWYKIDTWQGPAWVNIDLGVPEDLRKEETSIALTSETKVYEHPNKQARVLGILAPQTVEAFEHGSGWYHIQSDWLGDAWIYQADPKIDPDLYHPPATVNVKSVTADWTEQTFAFGVGWDGYPFAPEVSASGSNPPHSNVIQPGEPIHILFNVANTSKEDLTLLPSTSFEVDIVRRTTIYSQNKTELVWSGKLPPLTASFQGVGRNIQSQAVSVDWDQRDADGKQVPFGKYLIEIKTPTTIDYSKTGSEGVLHQVAKGSIRTSFPFTISAP